MDSRISSASRPDVVMIASTPRPTPATARVSFGQLLAAGASGLVQGAELAAGRLPGAPLAAAAVRAVTGNGAGGLEALAARESGAAPSAQPEGPGAASGPAVTLGAGGAAVAATPGNPGPGADPSGSINASLQQSAQLNLYYLQIQEQVDAQNRSFTALSNVLKTEHDSAKAAIQNIHS
jgi:hypothetical protein